MTLPNFLIIGKAKSGTTALHATLRQHPQIFMSPIKEPRFFVCDGHVEQYAGPMRLFGVDSIEQYQSLFTHATNQRAIGEASPQYLHISLAETAARSIHYHIPQARLIAILRQPAEYAWSMFHHLYARGQETAISLREALEEEGAGQRVGWYPALLFHANSQCYPQLAAYFQRFAPDQIKVYLYEDWKCQPQTMLADIFDFLEVDNLSSQIPIGQYNATTGQRNIRLHKLLARPNPVKTLLNHLLLPQWRQRLKQQLIAFNRVPLPPIDPQLRSDFTADLREDILRTQDLIGRDLSHWLD